MVLHLVVDDTVVLVHCLTAGTKLLELTLKPAPLGCHATRLQLLLLVAGADHFDLGYGCLAFACEAFCFRFLNELHASQFVEVHAGTLALQLVIAEAGRLPGSSLDFLLDTAQALDFSNQLSHILQDVRVLLAELPKLHVALTRCVISLFESRLFDLLNLLVNTSVKCLEMLFLTAELLFKMCLPSLKVLSHLAILLLQCF